MEKLLIPTLDAANSLGMGLTKLYEYLDKPEGIPVVRIGRSVRVHVDDVRAFAERQRVAAHRTSDLTTDSGTEVNSD
jgi:excisionase family DNA binding protein